MMKRFATILTVLVLGFTLVACGGGGGGGGPTVNANGFWVGTVTDSSIGTFQVLLLLQDGEVFGYSTEIDMMYHGFYTVSGSKISADIDSLSNTYGSYANRFNGNVVAESRISASFTSSGGSSGQANATFDPYYNNPSDITMLQGNWQEKAAPAIIGGLTADQKCQISIDGQLTTTAPSAGDTHQLSNATISIINPNKAVYDLSWDIHTTPGVGEKDGHFDGYAYLTNEKDLAVMLAGGDRGWIIFTVLGKR